MWIVTAIDMDSELRTQQSYKTKKQALKAAKNIMEDMWEEEVEYADGQFADMMENEYPVTVAKVHTLVCMKLVSEATVETRRVKKGEIVHFKGNHYEEGD